MAFITANRARPLIRDFLQGSFGAMVGLRQGSNPGLGTTLIPSESQATKSSDSVQYIALVMQPVSTGGFRHSYSYSNLQEGQIGGVTAWIYANTIPFILVSSGRNIQQIAFTGSGIYANKIIAKIPIETPTATKDTMYFFENIEFTVV